MNEGKDFKEGTATVNLSDFQLGEGPWPCRVYSDVIGRPDHVDIHFPAISIIELLFSGFPDVRNRAITISLNDGTTITSVLQACGNSHGKLFKEVWTGFHLARSVVRRGGSDTIDKWVFHLSNVKLNYCDKITDYGTYAAKDAVCFTIAERQWTLVDEYSNGKWKELTELEQHIPLLSGRLETDYDEGDIREDIEKMATDIESLLCFACARSIRWVSLDTIANDNISKTFYSNAWVGPFAKAIPVNDNIAIGQLREFIENCYPAFAADCDWFRQTITLFLASKDAPYLEDRLSLQNILLERITTKVLAGDKHVEIDPDLNVRLNKPFKRRLHELLSELSPNWTEQRTEQLITKVKEWNRRPSIPTAIERTALKLGLWPPSKKHLAKRHKLIHTGDFAEDDAGTILGCWTNMECLLTMMLLRMLDYLGPFYHMALGTKAKNLEDLVVAGTQEPPYDVGNRESLVRALAYHHWKERGMPEGDDWTDWFWAENNLPEWCEHQGVD